mgnify:CR=1 FL=1
MDVKHAAARKSFELAFSGVYKYITKIKKKI